MWLLLVASLWVLCPMRVAMFRFLRRLNKDITNVMELQPYMDLEDLVNLAIKVKKQMKRKSSARPRAYSGWKMNYRRERVMYYQSQ
jgi:hypothetical protein